MDNRAAMLSCDGVVALGRLGAVAHPRVSSLAQEVVGKAGHGWVAVLFGESDRMLLLLLSFASGHDGEVQGNPGGG